MSHVLRQRITIIALLLLMFGVRAYQPNLQDAYIDEGFHLRRAATIYDFEQNPAREAHGKLLLYFWLGLFVSDDAATSLPAGRLSIALFSVISGATIYLLGRMFANHRAGRLALLIYALMPLSVFYERMALADPLASGLMMLVLWRSYVFARNPSYRQGVLLGILIALASLAKLTMLLAVFFPLIAAIIYNKKKQNIAQFIRLYIPPLVLSGAIFCLMWSPFIIPAYFARNSDSPYILVNSRNIVRNESDPSSIPDYLQRLMPGIGNFMLDDHSLREFGSMGNPITIPEAIHFQVVWLIIGLWLLAFPFSPRHHLYVVCWFIAVTILLVTISSFVSTRYFMPIAAPLAVMSGMLLSPEMPISASKVRAFYIRLFKGLRWMIGLAFGLWMILWAIPFVVGILTLPETLPFNESNWLEYQSGILTADEATVSAASVVNQLNTDESIYATWNLCHIIYFLIERDITCIPQYDTPGHIVRAIQSLAEGNTLLLLSSGYPPYYEEWDFVSYTVLAEYDHEIFSRPIQAIRIQYKP